jgi:hypothetical protein
MVGKAGGELPDDPGEPLDLPEQKPAPVAAEGPAVKPRGDVAGTGLRNQIFFALSSERGFSGAVLKLLTVSGVINVGGMGISAFFGKVDKSIFRTCVFCAYILYVYIHTI